VIVLIAGNEALAKMASTGLMPNMPSYLMGSYNLHFATANQILLIPTAASNFTPLIGAFIADSYVGRFLGVGIGSFISCMVILYIHFLFTSIFHCTVFFLSFDLNIDMTLKPASV